MYSTNIDINHSEIEFLLNCGVSFPETLLNKLGNAYSITTRLTENQDWLSGFNVDDIVEILTVSELDDKSKTFMVWKHNIEDFDNVKNFVKSKNIDINEVRIIIEEFCDFDGEETQNITMVLRDNVYKGCSLFLSSGRNGGEWYIKYGNQKQKKFGEFDSVELKEN